MTRAAAIINGRYNIEVRNDVAPPQAPKPRVVIARVSLITDNPKKRAVYCIEDTLNSDNFQLWSGGAEADPTNDQIEDARKILQSNENAAAHEACEQVLQDHFKKHGQHIATWETCTYERGGTTINGIMQVNPLWRLLGMQSFNVKDADYEDDHKAAIALHADLRQQIIVMIGAELSIGTSTFFDYMGITKRDLQDWVRRENELNYRFIQFWDEYVDDPKNKIQSIWDCVIKIIAKFSGDVIGIKIFSGRSWSLQESINHGDESYGSHENNTPFIVQSHGTSEMNSSQTAMMSYCHI